MKKGSLNFLNRKSQSLFDTNVQIKDMDKLDLVINSNIIPESGTAKVRARPTVKHVTTYGDNSLGFAVPTPKVPVLPPVSGSHTGSTERLVNGGVITVSDPEEGEICIPPPPSVAPPPPPQFIPPPREFFGELDPSVDLAGLQPPSMPAPMPPSLSGSVDSEELHLASLKPPPMAPPKPPSNNPNLKGSIPINNNINTTQNIPPLTQGEKTQYSLTKTQKTPPPKPVRLYSASSLEVLPTGPATPVSTTSATPASSFNPQTTAKLYTVPKTTVLGSHAVPEVKTQHILLLEDSSGNPVGVHVNGKSPPSNKDHGPAQSLGPPSKPMRRNSSDVQLEQDLQVQREDLQETLPSQVTIQPTKPNMTNNGDPSKAMIQEVPNRIPMPTGDSSKTEEPLVVQSTQEMRQVKEQQASPSGSRSYSPLLNRKLQVLRGHESSGVKEVAASPLALLKAAKERDKQRAVLSRQSSTQSSSSSESTNFNAQPYETRPNSIAVSSKAVSSSRPASSYSESVCEEPKLAPRIDPETNVQNAQFSPSKPKPIILPSPPPSSSLCSTSPTKQEGPTLSASLPGQDKDHMDVVGIPFIPPPPEFANSDQDDEDKGPPRSPPPDPPAKSVIQPVKSSPYTNGPATFPKPTTSRNSAPVTASPSTESNIKMPVQTSPKPSLDQVQVPPPPTTQPPAPPSAQPLALKTLPPPPPKTQPPAPPKTQPPAPPKTQPPAPPKAQTSAPPKTQPPVPPSQALPPALTLQGPPPTPPKVPPPTPPKVPPPALPPQALPTVHHQPPALPKTQSPALLPQTPPSVSASQATLLSILQKKMLDMDPKFIRSQEPDSSGEDWNSPLSDDDGEASSPIKSPPKPKSVPIQGRGLDIKELETKVAKKAQNTVAKAPASSQSKQQFGMTFTVRPGTKQPITPLPKAQ